MTEKQIAKHLAEFFKDEPEKITLRWFTDNPLLGGVKPAHLYLLNLDKFKAWLKSKIEESLE